MTDTFDNLKNGFTHSYLKFKGVYDWQKLMRFLRSWVEKNHYTYLERRYKEKPGQYGDEIEWNVDTYKKVDGFYRYWIIWFLHIWDQVPVERVKDGKKETKDDGRIMIRFNSRVEWDFEGQFEGNALFKKMENFLTEHIVKEDIDSIHWDGLYYEMNRFKNDVEAHLNMESATIGSPYHG